jgi:hypothetical protein
MDTDRYDRKITMVSKSGFTGGREREEVIDFEELLKEFDSGSLVHAFLKDDDVQEMRVASSNLGFIHTFRKTTRK